MFIPSKERQFWRVYKWTKNNSLYFVSNLFTLHTHTTDQNSPKTLLKVWTNNRIIQTNTRIQIQSIWKMIRYQSITSTNRWILRIDVLTWIQKIQQFMSNLLSYRYYLPWKWIHCHKVNHFGWHGRIWVTVF